MIQPSVSELLKKVENRYTLVNVTAKRARMLTAGAQPLSVTKSDKDVTIAINEINEGKVRYNRIKREESQAGSENRQASFN
jgi:DNA-directed RNA polymerase subunit omega